MTDLTKGRKASLVMMHNRGRSIPEMVEITKECPREIRAFLETRKGFPGPIVTSGPSGKIKHHVSQYGSVYVAPVTLPKLKCLE